MAAIVKIIVKSIGGVLIIKNYSICFENPILNTIPSKIPFVIDTMSLIKIYKNIIIRISITGNPTALNILYI